MLGDIANLASIATAVVAILAYWQFKWLKRQKRIALENYLALEFAGKRSPGDKGKRTTIHLVAALGMTESDILDAAFSSKKIKRTVGIDKETGRADCIFLEHEEQNQTPN